MDRLDPMADHCTEMSRHLRPVPSSPPGPIYVVGRTAYVRPGAPYVVAKCADDAVAAVLSLAGLESYRRAEMERDPALAEALAAWERDDVGLHGRERAARTLVTRGDAATSVPRLPHPSLLGKLLP